MDFYEGRTEVQTTARGGARACSVQVPPAQGFQEFWACLGEALKGKPIPGTLSAQAGGAGVGAATLSLWSVAGSSLTARTACSFRATVSSRLCQELGFLHPSDCPHLLLLLTNEFGAGEKEIRLVFFSFSKLLARFHILPFSALAPFPHMPRWDASQSVSFNGGKGRAGSPCHSALAFYAGVQ